MGRPSRSQAQVEEAAGLLYAGRHLTAIQQRPGNVSAAPEAACED